MPFAKLAEVNRPRHVVESILSSIQDGSLAALRLMGVVETRVGAGSFVSASLDGGAMSSDIANEISQAISASEEAAQLQEARAVFECGLVRLAVARWSPEKAEAFEQLFSSMENSAVSGGYADYIRLHRDFHLMLARATDNAIVEGTERSFLETMDHEGWQDMERQFLLPDRAEYLQASLTEHRSIIEAVNAGDVVEASERMHQHFTRHEGEANGG